MFDTQIHLIKNNLLKNNPIFSNNGFYYKNSIELAQNGISDSFINMFYIRPIIKSDRRFSFKQGDMLDTIIGTFRLVIQLSPKYKNPIEPVLTQLEDVRVLGFNDETAQVYKAEHDKEMESDSFKLYLIDFEMIIEKPKYSCAQKCIELC